ncbi:hypothetical protein OXH55_15750 [Clostridium ganghwense]|uniref:Transcriptional regulator n=1 Tax=Clostridium ganghwense TaxID=312089 RepID=A0ABT4CSN7_9CLOT|nr:hypothetical protein [Clostridium ganghwense]
MRSKEVITLLSFIQNQRKVVEKEIIRLKSISTAIGHIEDKIKYALEIKETNKIYFREIEKRFIIDVELNRKDNENDIEIKLRKMDKVVEDNELMFEGESGYFVDLDLFLNEGEICYKIIYSTICGEDIENKYVDTKEISEGKFICISYLNNEREMAVDKLRKYIEENNIHPRCIGVEVQLFNTLEQWKNEDVLYELQILI